MKVGALFSQCVIESPFPKKEAHSSNVNHLLSDE